jgi:hypothetical protein
MPDGKESLRAVVLAARLREVAAALIDVVESIDDDPGGMSRARVCGRSARMPSMSPKQLSTTSGSSA